MQQKLTQIKSGSSNLYNHMVQVLKELLLNNDRNAYHLFQYYSQKVKQQNGGQGSCRDSQLRSEEYKELAAYVDKMKSILDKPKQGGEDQEPIESSEPTGYVPNLMEQSKWLERCGVGFGEQLTYIIFKSLEKFSIEKKTKQLRFWGKIVASNKDYYIIETPAEEGGDEQLPADVEPKGKGINMNTYWVTTDLNGQWTELPVIHPIHMKVSRKIKYLFTGDLSRVVSTNPHFAGTEAHLLKCQIVRISFSCTVVPKTKFVVNQESPKDIQPYSGQEDWKWPSFSFLSELTNWVHYPQNILKNGRMEVIVQTQDNQQIDVDQLTKQLEAKDPIEERLKPISSDRFGTNQNAWTIKRYGDCSQYKAMSKIANEQINYGFVCLRSLVWKGWTSVYHNKELIHLYIGNGFKSSNEWFFPKEPEAVMKQVEDKEEQPEPSFPPPIEQEQQKEKESGQEQKQELDELPES